MKFCKLSCNGPKREIDDSNFLNFDNCYIRNYIQSIEKVI